MTPMLSWTVLNTLAWIFGLKAAYDLRAEFDPSRRTWVFLTWAVWACLLMELAMVGAPFAGGLDLFSYLTGIVSGIFLWLTVSSLQRDIRTDAPKSLPSTPWERLFVAGGVASLLGSIALGRWLPAAERALAGAVHVVDGTVWLAVSGWLIVAASLQPSPRRDADVYMPPAIGFAFAFAFVNAALAPLARLTGWRIDREVGTLFDTLFVLTLVTTLYAMVLHVRSRRLVAASMQLHSAQEQLFGVEKLVAVGTLAAGAAHDFNNALTTILGYTELALNSEALPADVREDLRSIQRASGDAATLTNQLLGLARRPAGRSTFADVAETLRAPLDSLARDFRRHNIKVVTRFEPVRSPAVDLSLLFQVCLNLYLNARDAMMPTGGGTLEVSLYPVERAIAIAVRDTGGGIPESFRSRIFQPLQTTKGAAGTGLGLSVSKSIVESMGGRIRYESVEGQGTAFYITLPLDGGDRRRDTSEAH